MGREPDPRARRPTRGSADLIAELISKAVPVEEVPVKRTGALGPIESVYVSDPDGNLIELSTYGSR